MRVRSLRVRLLLMFMLVAIVAVGAIAVFASRATGGAFEHYLSRQQSGDQQLISQIMTAYYQKNSQQVQALVEKAAQAAKIRIIVVNHTDNVIADSNGQL